MSEYTYKDVIIDPEDPRVEIGAEYCFGDIPQNLVEAANSNNNFWARLEKISVSEAFNFKKEGGGWKVCLIRKKEPEKKYAPFDLSKEEDRARLRGAWIRRKDYPGDEYQIVGISITNDLIFFDDSAQLSTDVLLKRCEFVDGSPCGKLVEE